MISLTWECAYYTLEKAIQENDDRVNPKNKLQRELMMSRDDLDELIDILERICEVDNLKITFNEHDLYEDKEIKRPITLIQFKTLRLEEQKKCSFMYKDVWPIIFLD